MADGTTLDRFRSAVHLKRGLAITATVIAVVISYTTILVGLNQGLAEGTSQSAGSLLGVGLGLMPFVYALAAVTTGHPRLLLAVAKSVGLWLLATPLLIIDIILGLTAAYSLGLTTALHHPTARWSSRLVVVAMVVVLTLILLVLAPPAALFGPLIAAGPAIALSDDRAELFNRFSR